MHEQQQPDLRKYLNRIADENGSIDVIMSPEAGPQSQQDGTVIHDADRCIESISIGGLKPDADPSEVHYVLGCIYGQMQAFQNALNHPNYARAYYERGWVYSKLNNSERAREDYERAINLNSELMQYEKYI
jgi:tetratricopeptide (TPR) repeat protein